MRVKRYRPNYFSGFPEEEAQADTLTELLAIPWVATWAAEPTFHRFSIAESNHLMAELEDGYVWWVVALIEGHSDFGLPRWEAKRRARDDQSTAQRQKEEMTNPLKDAIDRMQAKLGEQRASAPTDPADVVCHWCGKQCGGTCLGLTQSTQMKTSDPAYWMLTDGHRSTPEVYRDGCYICSDVEFAAMGLPLCKPCPQCSAEHQAEYPEVDTHVAGHIPADDEVCDDCGYNLRVAWEEEQEAKDA